MKLYSPRHISGTTSMGKVGLRGMKMSSPHLSFKSSIHVIKAPKAGKVKL